MRNMSKGLACTLWPCSLALLSGWLLQRRHQLLFYVWSAPPLITIHDHFERKSFIIRISVFFLHSSDTHTNNRASLPPIIGPQHPISAVFSIYMKKNSP
ncbi:hypothetical protein B0F90DRAFT_401670 [Multifurca ochricompacta]|uniref:Secreted protein n=1 Tax=Multifurca ochricompacta TaxID=376703 RepID=A0AAD4M3K9_9AGAM|nr:hypothetical protein B0F90DRAFT_401670 [Multifurca ochricompacta]